MPTLRENQSQFARMVADLIQHAHDLGYEVTLGEAWRPQATALLYAKSKLGIANSLHIDRLAIDLNLFKDGVFLPTTEDHLILGEYWENVLHGAWGGRFKKPDGNHYSLPIGDGRA